MRRGSLADWILSTSNTSAQSGPGSPGPATLRGRGQDSRHARNNSPIPLNGTPTEQIRPLFSDTAYHPAKQSPSLPSRSWPGPTPRAMCFVRYFSTLLLLQRPMPSSNEKSMTLLPLAVSRHRSRLPRRGIFPIFKYIPQGCQVHLVMAKPQTRQPSMRLFASVRR